MPHFEIVFQFFLWCLRGALSLISISIGRDSARHLAEVKTTGARIIQDVGQIKSPYLNINKYSRKNIHKLVMIT